MDPSFIQFLLFISKLINLHNPLLILTQEENIPLPLCNGTAFPIICFQYPSGDNGYLVEELLAQGKYTQYYPIFISDGYHDRLVTQLAEHPLLFTTAHVWVMPLRYAKEVPLRLDNNIFFYDGNSSVGYSVYESYAIKGKKPEIKMLFRWNQDNASTPRIPSTMDRRSNLNGAVLRDSWLDDQRLELNFGFNEIFWTLQAKLNFSSQFVAPKPGWFGTRFQNGSWNGLAGMLIEDNIDFLAGLMVSEKRQDALDFAWPIHNKKITLFGSKSSTPRLNMWVYVNVFPLSAWVSGFALLLLAIFCFSISCKETITQSATLMGRLFLQIGYELPIQGIASRALLMTAALFMNMVFIFYTSDLTANMTASPKELDIKSFEDVERLGYQVIGPRAGALPSALMRDAPKTSPMWRIYNNKYSSTRELTDISKKGAYGEMTNTLIWSSYKDNVKNLVQLDIIEAVITPKTFAFNKDSELTALFNHQILTLIESGVIYKAMSGMSRGPDDVYGISDAVVIGFENLLFPFAWVALGSILAMPIILGEMILHRCKSFRSITMYGQNSNT